MMSIQTRSTSGLDIVLPSATYVAPTRPSPQDRRPKGETNDGIDEGRTRRPWRITYASMVPSRPWRTFMGVLPYLRDRSPRRRQKQTVQRAGESRTTMTKEVLFAWTAPGSNYPAYVNFSREGDTTTVIAR